MHAICAALSLLAACIAAPAGAQDRGDAAARVAVPGMVFTRALNGAAEGSRVEGQRLVMTSRAKTDNFIEPDGSLANNSAPVLLAEIDNRKPFTLTARVTPELIATYDAGALYLWVRPDWWLKMALERDERGLARMVSVRTQGTSDDNNHDVVAAKSVHMKISSDTKTVGFYYSTDAVNWQLIRLFRNDYPAALWLGVSAQSPVGKGQTAAFEDIALSDKSIADFRMGK